MGDEVLSTSHEYGAMDRTWRFLAKEHGFTYINRHISLNSKTDFVESFWAGVTLPVAIQFQEWNEIDPRFSSGLQLQKGCGLPVARID